MMDDILGPERQPLKTNPVPHLPQTAIRASKLIYRTCNARQLSAS